MEKTIRSLMLLMIITGTIFTACGPETRDPAEEEKVNGVEVEIGNEVEIKGAETVDDSKNDDAAEPVSTPPKTDTGGESSEPTVQVQTKYTDGTYTKTGGYQSPAGAESVTVTVTVKDDAVRSVNVVSNAVNETTKQMQGLFIAGVNQLVVGKKLDEAGVFGNVNGSSLTGGGFNNAVAAIKAGALR